MVEHWLVAPVVVGSSPTFHTIGKVPEWSNGPDCKSGASASEVRILPFPLMGLSYKGLLRVTVNHYIMVRVHVNPPIGT